MSVNKYFIVIKKIKNRKRSSIVMCTKMKEEKLICFLSGAKAATVMGMKKSVS